MGQPLSLNSSSGIRQPLRNPIGDISNWTDDGGVRLVSQATPVHSRTIEGGIRLIVMYDFERISSDFVRSLQPMISRTPRAQVQDNSAPREGRIIPALFELEESSSEDMQGVAFPFNVSDQFSASEAEEMERILAQGPPQWVRDLRDQVRRQRP